MPCPRCGAPVNPGQPQCMNCGLMLVRVSTRRPNVVTFLAVLYFLSGLMEAAVAIYLANAGRHNAQGLFPEIRIYAFLAIGIAIGAMILAGMSYGLIAMRSWGRILQIIVSILGLLAFPLGTIISIMLLIYFFKPGVKALFSGRPYEQFTPQEIASLQEVQNGGKAIIAVICIIIALNVVASAAMLAFWYPKYKAAMEQVQEQQTTTTTTTTTGTTTTP